MSKSTSRRLQRPNEDDVPERMVEQGAAAIESKQPAGASDLFQAAELERMGLLPVRDTNYAGALFRGDGARAKGWYHAWTGDGYTVVTCNFTMLVDTLFGIDTRRYLTVRGPAAAMTAYPGYDVESAQPAAIAYIETREDWVTMPISAGTRFAYTEVEYFDEALREAFAGLGWDSVDGLSALLVELRGSIGWAPGVLSALEEIGRTDPAVAGAPLIYEGSAKVLLGSLVQATDAVLPTDRRSRAGILAAIDFASVRLREGATQEEAAAVSGMGLTTFKRLFKQATGRPWAAYLAERRMHEAKRLLSAGVTVEQAAHAVGYRSPTSFSAAFSRVIGVSPGRWRTASRMDVAGVADEADQ